MVILPESPWHWARKQKVAQAKTSLRRLYGNVPDYDVDREYAVMEKEIAHAKAIHAESKLPRFAEIFKGVNLRRTLASMMPIMLQQLCGVPIFFSYLTCKNHSQDGADCRLLPDGRNQGSVPIVGHHVCDPLGRHYHLLLDNRTRWPPTASSLGMCYHDSGQHWTGNHWLHQNHGRSLAGLAGHELHLGRLAEHLNVS